MREGTILSFTRLMGEESVSESKKRDFQVFLFLQNSERREGISFLSPPLYFILKCG